MSKRTLENTLESKMSVPWIEKYRPKNLSQISSQSETVNILQKTLNSGNVYYYFINYSFHIYYSMDPLEQEKHLQF